MHGRLTSKVRNRI